MASIDRTLLRAGRIVGLVLVAGLGYVAAGIIDLASVLLFVASVGAVAVLMGAVIMVRRRL